VGNSFNPAEPHFHNIFIKGAPTCSVANTFQAHERVRKTIDDILYYSLPAQKSLNFKRNTFEKNHEEILDFKTTYQHQVKITNAFLNELKYTNPEKYYETIKGKNAIGEIRDGTVLLGTEAEEGLSEIIKHTRIEKLISDAFYPEMFDRFLEICNYTKQTNEDTKSSSVKFEKTKEIIKVNDIQQCRDEKDTDSKLPTIQSIKLKIDTKKASVQDKLISERYHFERLVSNHEQMSEDTKNHYFNMYLKGHTKSILEKFRDEHASDVGRVLFNSCCKDTIHERQNLRAVKLDYILKLNKFLGIKNTYTPGIQVSKEKIEQLESYLNENEYNINKAFNFTKLKKSPNKIISSIRRIYKSWSNFQFTLPKNEQGKRMKHADCKYYNTSNSNVIDDIGLFAVEAKFAPVVKGLDVNQTFEEYMNQLNPEFYENYMAIHLKHTGKELSFPTKTVTRPIVSSYLNTEYTKPVVKFDFKEYTWLDALLDMDPLTDEEDD
jgi:hypothetical protein